MSITVEVYDEAEAEDCEAVDGKIPCGESGVVEINAFRRLVLGTWMTRSNTLCPKHARELRNALINELKDG